MKRFGKTLMLLGIISSFILLIYTSCKKEFSCEDCYPGGKPPIADAGGDTYILLPVDSVVLDGSNSSDQDDGIAEYKWRKVLGSDTFTLRTPGSSKSVVAKLVKGNYQFELTVTDKGGLTGKDTVQITISPAIISNRPPVANAGQDTTISLPANIARLDGSRSTDPDKNISNYSWNKISGPASYTIANTGSALTEVINLTEGIYSFELRVTDLGGLFSLDTVQIKVQHLIISKCDNSNRKLINAGLTQFGMLSQTRADIAVAAAGNKILFAGGNVAGQVASSRVDIYDIASGSWTTAELSQARWGIATVTSGGKMYFAGGHFLEQGNPMYSSRVDIFDVTNNSWSIAELSSPRTYVTAVAAGSKVFFAGGDGNDLNTQNSNAPIVDIYNTSTATWSEDNLRERVTTGIVQDMGIAGTAIGDRIYFAGNASDWFAWDFGSITSKINVYNATTGNWITSDLTLARGFMGSIAVGDYNYWAGGVYKQRPDAFTDLVEIRNMSTGTSTLTCLFQPNAFLSAVQKQNDIVFFTPGYDLSSSQQTVISVYNKFDIYNIPSGTWSMGVLAVDIYGSTIVSYKDVIYVAGGTVNGVLSNKVSKLEF